MRARSPRGSVAPLALGMRLPPTLRAASAHELIGDLPLRPESLAALRSGASPAEYVDALLEQQRSAEAVLVLAHSLTTEDSIWWGLSCALAAHDAQPDPADGPALDLVGDWTLSPSPELSLEARTIARELEMDRPAAWVALAVSWTSPPKPELAAQYRLAVSHAVAAAVQLTAADAPVRGAYTQNLRALLERGVSIALGGDGGVDRLDPPMFPGTRASPRVPRPWLEEP